MPDMTPQQREAVVTKQYPNAFRETELKSILDATTRAAADLGYTATVVADACATRDLEFGGRIVAAADVHAAYMSALAFGYAEVKATDEVSFA